MTGMRQGDVDTGPGNALARSCGPKSQVVRCAPEAGNSRFEASLVWELCRVGSELFDPTQATGSVLSQEYASSS